MLVCWACCQTFHNEQYGYVDNTGRFKFTSRWYNMSEVSRIKTSNDYKLGIILKKMERTAARNNNFPQIAVADVYATLLNKNHLHTPTDWTHEFAENMGILYGCHNCMIYPLRSNGWWRCTAEPNAKATSHVSGHWRCCNCFARGTCAKKKNNVRLLVIAPSRSQIFTAFLGDTSPTFDTILRFLRSCTVLSEIDGHPITKSVLVNAIDAMNSQHGRRWWKLMAAVLLESKHSKRSKSCRLLQGRGTVHETCWRAFAALDLTQFF